VELRSQLKTERADHDQCRTFWLKGKNCIGSGKNEKLGAIAIGVEFPEPADLLNQLKGKRKKSKAELADVATILEVLQDTD
jgi:hypothetical protein